jgi:hypothetical protein
MITNMWQFPQTNSVEVLQLEQITSGQMWTEVVIEHILAKNTEI